MALIKLTKRDGNGVNLGDVVVNTDAITRIVRCEDHSLTDIYLSDGTSFTVYQTVDALLKVVQEVKGGD